MCCSWRRRCIEGGFAGSGSSESPVAAVILKPDAMQSSRELVGWVNERVEARFQKVKDVVILDEFPRTATGKILKRSLRDQHGK